MIRRSTLHLDLSVIATDGDLPFGTTALNSSHVTLIPIFLLFRFPAFTFTLVSRTIFRGTPLFFFRSDFSEVTESVSSSLEPETMTFLKTVWFLVGEVKAGKVPFPKKTSLDEKIEMSNG